MSSNEDLALSNCDKEPVHIPGRIQPFGAMLGFDTKSKEVLHYSANLGQMVFPNSEVKLGQSYVDLINHSELLHGIRSSMSLPTIRNQRDRIGSFSIAGATTDVSAYGCDNLLVVEFEPRTRRKGKSQSAISSVRSMMAAINMQQDMDSLLQTAVKSLRQLTGHDRIMAYRFLDNGDGEVVAESTGVGIEPFLGLRYPAWDIPMQVRQIMLRAPFRVIHDIHAEHAALVSAADAEPVDMTLSHLRGVSPIHVEYLANMGVRSTMNVSIIVKGQLWGLFAFHHYRPRMLTVDQRSICELFGQLISMKIQQEEERERLADRQRTQSILSAIGSSSGEPAETLVTVGDDLLRVMKCDGVSYVSANKVASLGETPGGETVRNVCGLCNEDTAAIESLTQTGSFSKKQLGDTAGALILSVAEEQFLIFFRREVIHEIRWAGNKEKVIKSGPFGPRLSPRQSFAEYREAIVERCRRWKSIDLELATDVRRELMKSMFVNVSQIQVEWERQKRYQDLLVAELNHRVRNTLALVRSIAKQTISSSTSLETYVTSLEQRIRALSVAHDLIGGSGQQWARIDDLIRQELRPFETGDNRVKWAGPPFGVRADVAPIISLLLHEMTTNAVKHGALSDNGVSLDVCWFEDDAGVTLTWTETLVEKIDAPENRGFGFALIERALPYECDGHSFIDFRDHELEIKFWLPMKNINRMAAYEAEQAAVRIESVSEVESASHADPDFRLFAHIDSALVVEDNMILSMELEKMLTQLGIAKVSTASNKAFAEAAIDHSTFNIAILDINLGVENSLNLAVELRKRKVPIVLASGYDSQYQLPSELVGIPRITKPIGQLELSAAISDALTKT